MEEVMSEKLSALLRASAFATMEEARRFAVWYMKNPHHTGWDDTRHHQATELFRQEVDDIAAEKTTKE
jgi:hypothetical protein